MNSGVRNLAALAGLLVPLALFAWGCSGSDDADQPAAAVQPVDVATLEVSSANFQETVRPRKRIPQRNTCFAENMSPPLDWGGVPEGTKSLALIVEEPEERISGVSKAYFSVAASGDAVHWVLYNIPPAATGLLEGVPTTTDVLPDGTVQGVNESGQMGYSGPCPPPSVVSYGTAYHNPQGTTTSDPPHDYYFRLYALDAMVELAPGATAAELTGAIQGHILGYGETLGKFQVPRQQGWFVGDAGTPVVNTPTPATSSQTIGNPQLSDKREGGSPIMYLLRRVYKVKPGTTRQAAKLIHEIGKRYEEAGQRSSVKVYWSGYTVPGPANTVYMDWVQESLESPSRKGNKGPDTSDLGVQLREIQEETYIEFYEMEVDR